MERPIARETSVLAQLSAQADDARTAVGGVFVSEASRDVSPDGEREPQRVPRVESTGASPSRQLLYFFPVSLNVEEDVNRIERSVRAGTILES